MRAFSTISAVFLLALNTWALTITDPGQNTVWDSSTQSQTVSWNSVATDPTNFTVLLVNMQSYPNINTTLKENVLTSSGSTTVDGPSSGWPIGSGFQINFIQLNPTGVGILAQSNQFSINGTTVPFSSSASRPSGTGTSTGTSPSSTTSGTTKNGDSGLTVQTGFMAGLLIVGAILA